MKRRSVVRAAGGGAVAGLAGCFSRDENDADDDEQTDVEDEDEEPEEPDLEGTLRVATTETMVTGDRAAGEYLREAFEEEFPDAELQWTLPEAGLEHYVRRARQDAEIDADAYLGLTPMSLARVDRRLDGRTLFREFNDERIAAIGRLREGLEFDDSVDRLLPAGVRYSCVLYDEAELERTDLEPPDTLTALTDEDYAETLLLPSPERAESGLAFLLWTIEAFGADDAVDYWHDLDANGVRITPNWAANDETYAAGERPLSIAYSTDPMLAVREDRELDRYGVAFPGEQGYQTPVGMAIFEDADELDLAYDFLNFVLSSETQAELAERHLLVPALDDAFVDLEPEIEPYTETPAEPVSLDYELLRNNLEVWLDDWESAVGG